MTDVSDGDRHAAILRNEVRMFLGEGAPDVSDEQIDALARDYPNQPRAICAALRRLRSSGAPSRALARPDGTRDTEPTPDSEP